MPAAVFSFSAFSFSCTTLSETGLQSSSLCSPSLTENALIPSLERASRKTIGDDTFASGRQGAEGRVDRDGYSELIADFCESLGGPVADDGGGGMLI